jgi:hypothetical protein
MIWAGITAAWYILGTFTRDVLDAIETVALIHILFIITEISTLAPLLLVVLKKGNFTKVDALLLAVLQFLVLKFNALNRQWEKDFSIAKIVDLNRKPVVTQWSSIIPFLLIFTISVQNKLLMLLTGHFYIYSCFENKRFFNSSPLIPLLLLREGEIGVEF